jgi:hypothetical protein
MLNLSTSPPCIVLFGSRRTRATYECCKLGDVVAIDNNVGVMPSNLNANRNLVELLCFAKFRVRQHE